MLELINRARANPAVEAARYAIGLNEGVPTAPVDQTISNVAKQPLAFSPSLIDAARGHSQDMIDHDYFAHDSFDGTYIDDRFIASGYGSKDAQGQDSFGYGENIVWRGSTPAAPPLQATTAQLHQDLFVDAGYDGRGHRINMLFGDFKEVGVGIVPGPFYDAGQDVTYNALMATVDFAYSANTVFLTGVAYFDDLVPDQFYEPGEGIGGLTITAVRNSDSATFTTTAFSTGGYTIPIEAGTYTVTASGPGLDAPMVAHNVVIGQDNVKVDFVGSATQGTSQITGNAYDDLNQDGLFTAGEGIGGLTVTALRTAGGTAVSASATTSATGGYTLNVASGTYKLTVTGAALDAPMVVENVVVGHHAVNVDVAKPPAQVSGVVYDDLNYDQRYAASEGIGGLTVSAAPASGNVPAVTTTSFAGGYTLSLEPGGYTLTVSGSALDTPIVRAISVGQHNASLADMVKTPAQVSGVVYDDLNGDQACTSGEELPGLTVSAVRTVGGVSPALSATTSATGGYTLSLEPGTYTLTVSGAALDAPMVRSVVVGQHDAGGFDFVKPPPQLAGVVYSDLNLDGSYTPGEPVFPGAIIQATPAAGAAVFAVTDAGGAYSMIVGSGTYTVTASGTGLDAPLTVRNVAVGRRNVKVYFANPVSKPANIPDKTPPAARFSGTKLVTTAAALYKFTVTYSDPSKVKRSTIGTGDLLVTGPKAFKTVKPTFVSTTAKVDAATMTVVYSFVPTGGKWAATLNGTYTVTLNPKQVSDVKGNSLARPLALGTFVVSLKKTKTAAKPLATPVVSGPPADTLFASYPAAGLFAANPIRRATSDIF